MRIFRKRKNKQQMVKNGQTRRALGFSAAAGILAITALFIVTPLATQAADSSVPVQGQGLDVISRADWGADESYRKNPDGSESWPAEYANPQVFIVHHTAGSNGQPSLEQAKAVVRGIYYYHAIVRGWGDIGYNYLIDTDGNIFEGRAGGDGVIAAHAYRDNNCPGKGPEQSYNSGSIGIALLGNYESVDSASAAAKAALSHLIAVKGRALNINPAGQVFFKDRTISTVFGHAEIDCTTCPGGHIKTKLDSIRTTAAAEYETLPPPAETGTIKGQRVDQSATSIVLAPGRSRELTVDVRNTGTAAWRRSVNAPVLVTTNLQTRLLRSTAWINSGTAATLEQETVAPGQIGRYRLTVTAPSEPPALIATFKLAANGTRLSGTTTTFAVSIPQKSYAAEILDTPVPEAILRGGSVNVTMTYLNTGRTTWQRSNVKLAMKDGSGGASAFTALVQGNQTTAIEMTEAEVPTGSQGHFTFTFASPKTLGQYRQKFYLVQNGKAISGGRRTIATRVDSASQAAVAEIDLPVAMLNTWAPVSTVRFTNTGVTPWDRSIVLRIMNDDFGPSSFYDPSWPGAVGEIVMDQARVLPGETATYHFRFRAPVDPRVYTQIFQLAARDDASVVIQHKFLSTKTRVDPAEPALVKTDYSAKKNSDTIPVALRSAWNPAVTVQYKNTGTKSWNRSVKLNIYGALFRRPEFHDPSWPTRTGGIVMNEASVPPGGTATYTFRLNAPDELQVYEVLFQLSLGSERQKIPGSYFSELIRVDP